MNSPKRRPTTYRFTPELDKRIAQEAEKLGISKNAFVQMTLSRLLENNKKIFNPTGTEGR